MVLETRDLNRELCLFQGIHRRRDLLPAAADYHDFGPEKEEEPQSQDPAGHDGADDSGKRYIIITIMSSCETFLLTNDHRYLEE